MASVLVTGGAGFIGSHLCEALVAGGHEVRVLDDLSSGKLENLSAVRDRISFREGSITDAPLVREMAAGCSCVLHLAAIVSVPRSMSEPLLTHEVNATGTLAVLEAAKAAKARFVFSSSAAVYGNTLNVPIRENEPKRPVSAYGAQKLYGEHLARCAAIGGLEAYCLRYFNVYGPRQDPSSPYSGVISIFADRAMRGEPLTVYGDGLQTRDFVHVSDVVRANLLAMAASTPDGSGLNVGTGVPTDLLQLAKLVFTAAGHASEVVHAPDRLGDIRDSYCAPSLSEERLGFRAATPLSVGLSQLVCSD